MEEGRDLELKDGNQITLGSEIEVTSSALIYQQELTDQPSSDVKIQCSLPVPESAKFDIRNFVHNCKAIQLYTGFDNYDHFRYFFQVLGPAVYCLNYRSSVLLPENQLFLTLIKLREAKEYLEPSILFQISQATVSKLVVTWINFMYFQLKEINIWPSREVVNFQPHV